MVEYVLAIIFIISSSFIKCLVDSDLNNEFFTRRSRCDTCQKDLKFINLIPIFSYLYQKGRCTYCKSKIHSSIFLYEVAGLVVALAYLFLGNKFLFVTYWDFWIILILLFIAVEDHFTFEINPRLQLILLTFVLVNLYMKWEYISILASLSMILVFNLIYYLTRGGIGYGDIKLFSILSLTLTFFDSIYLFLYTFIFAGFYAIYLLLGKKYKANMKVALASYIALAYIFVLLRGEFLW